MAEKKTPLYQEHLAAHGKIVPFAGYLLPVQYETGVIKEHMAVRTAAGLFDVSHMGEILVTGRDSTQWLQEMLTNDYTIMENGQARYSLMCNEQGGIVDDLIVYQYQPNNYLIVVNAANKDKDVVWMKQHLKGQVRLSDESDQIAQIALQGPKAIQILRKVMSENYLPKKYYHAVFDAYIDQISCCVSRTGYTGEDGVEIYLSTQDAPKMWNLLLEAGKEEGLIPCGLGARDTLRFEACMPLYGHELSDTITPFEAGLSSFVKMQKDFFIGKSALESKQITTRVRVGLKAISRGIIRENMTVRAGDEVIGQTTSGTFAPFLGYAAAMAMVKKEYAKQGTKVMVDIRGKMTEANVCSMPFYRRAKS